MARAKYSVPERLQCQQPNGQTARGSLINKYNGNANCERRATYIDEHGYRYCTQHAKEPATPIRKATGRIRAGLRSFNPLTGKAYEGAPLPQRATEPLSETHVAEMVGKRPELEIDRIVGGIIDAYELAPNDEDEKREAVARQVRAALKAEWERGYSVGNEDAVHGFRS